MPILTIARWGGRCLRETCSGTIRPEDVAVTAMSADAARRQVDCALPTHSNMVYGWFHVGSGVPGQSGMWIVDPIWTEDWPPCS